MGTGAALVGLITLQTVWLFVLLWVVLMLVFSVHRFLNWGTRNLPVAMLFPDYERRDEADAPMEVAASFQRHTPALVRLGLQPEACYESCTHHQIQGGQGTGEITMLAWQKLFRSPDRTLAVVLHVTHTHSQTPKRERDIVGESFALETELSNGTWINTQNSEYPPLFNARACVTLWLPEEQDVGQLLRAHRAVTDLHTAHPVQQATDLAAYREHTRETAFDQYRKHGIIRRVGDDHRYTRRGLVRSVLGYSKPLKSLHEARCRRDSRRLLQRAGMDKPQGVEQHASRTRGRRVVPRDSVQGRRPDSHQLLRRHHRRLVLRAIAVTTPYRHRFGPLTAAARSCSVSHAATLCFASRLNLPSVKCQVHHISRCEHPPRRMPRCGVIFRVHPSRGCGLQQTRLGGLDLV